MLVWHIEFYVFYQNVEIDTKELLNIPFKKCNSTDSRGPPGGGAGRGRRDDDRRGPSHRDDRRGPPRDGERRGPPRDGDRRGPHRDDRRRDDRGGRNQEKSEKRQRPPPTELPKYEEPKPTVS